MAALVAATLTTQAQTQTPTAMPMYGAQLMTDAERTEYQTKMRSLKTKAEKEAFRAEHHELMKTRAAEKGVTLPDAPMMGQGTQGHKGSGMGGGMGTGSGMGQGSGASGGGKGGK
jgi:1,2-phenylacetyl-CoA epoxidase catalytic subunit